ncbi:MAG: hypothetical protein K0U86_15180 [Planctomycetes bacterium]|nr:hypothetical protein [Planctomycetota bacterium]MCH9726241.1 hypothetical protein [Planctomycetota bacterium]MCH9775746.1 hypothetical protein [Planctomycetota bacterium]MCH9792933.1 hypothetical protein [Planctomycetota bacterium]MDF1745506.1 hypothetical protein [Gimesia sp.]
MIRSRLRWVKHLTLAIFTLMLFAIGCEVALRISEYREQVSVSNYDADGFLIPSDVSYHRIRPFQKVSRKQPDTGESVQFTINSMGLRGKEYTIPKPAGVFRILCLGGENVLAPEMEDPDTFCVRLENLLQKQTQLKVEVVNAGVPDACPLMSYLDLRHSLLGLQPDLILLHFDMSDVADDHALRRYTQLSDSGVPLCSMHPLFDQMNAPERLENHFLIYRYTLRWLGDYWVENQPAGLDRDIDTPQGKYLWLEDHPPDWSVYVRQTLEPIQNIQQIAQGTYSRFILATYPKPWQVSENTLNQKGVRSSLGVREGVKYTSRFPFDLLDTYAKQLNLSYCDTSPTFQNIQNPDRYYLNHVPQFSREGHALYARELALFILKDVPGIWSDSDPTNTEQPAPRQALVPGS